MGVEALGVINLYLAQPWPTRGLAYSPVSGLGRILSVQPAIIDETLRLETGFTSHLAATLPTMARFGAD